MTLHQTIEISKKVALWIGISLGGFLGLFMLFQLGVIVKNLLFPPPIQPPTVLYDKLQAITFPEDITTQPLTYTLQTVSGELPEFPDRLNVYPIVQPQPNFLNLNKVKEKVGRLGFVTENGTTLPERSLGNGNYEWRENTGLRRKILFNIVTFNFILESNYLSSLTVLAAKNLSTEKTALSVAKSFLDSMALMPEDIALEKTTTPFQNISFVTTPQLFSIQQGRLVLTSSLANAQVIRVNFYQKDLSYSLNTGVPDLTGTIQRTDVSIPILYPHPPYSTMSFWIASGENGPEVVAADFTHQTIAFSSETDATYPIKTAAEAFEELKNGNGYIASYQGDDMNVGITNVYLAYYLGATQQSYLLPIIVFEGEDGFFGYVSAIQNSWIINTVTN